MSVRRIAAPLLLLVALVVGLAAPVGAQTTRRECLAGTLVADVVYRYEDEQVLDTQGRVVGLASGVGRFRLYQLGPDTFCALSFVTGTFTTFAGPSPNGTGTVPEGLRGHVVGENVLLFTGEFDPELPTRGYVGEFDSNCDQFECATPIRFGRHYVLTEGPPEVLSYRFSHYTRCGIWVQTESSDVGDIAC